MMILLTDSICLSSGRPAPFMEWLFECSDCLQHLGLKSKNRVGLWFKRREDHFVRKDNGLWICKYTYERQKVLK